MRKSRKVKKIGRMIDNILKELRDVEDDLEHPMSLDIDEELFESCKCDFCGAENTKDCEDKDWNFGHMIDCPLEKLIVLLNTAKLTIDKIGVE